MSKTVLWDDDSGQLIVEPAARHASTMRSLRALQSAETVGELRQAELDDWARGVLESFVERLEEDEEEVTDSTPFDYASMSDWVIEVVPMPHDAENTASWLGWEFLAAHAEIGGASPGGNIDVYVVRDREAFLEALRGGGYEVEHRPGLMQEYWSAV